MGKDVRVWKLDHLWMCLYVEPHFTRRTKQFQLRLVYSRKEGKIAPVTLYSEHRS